MKEWLDEFYGSPATRAALETSLAPLFTELGGAAALVAGSEVGITNPVVGAFLQSMVSSYVDRHLNSSRVQLTELLDSPDPRAAIQQRLAEWTEKRPGKVAFEETFRTTNAVTETVYRDAGVTRKKWSARGKSCPYCRRMNGKVVEIDRPFHREGDAIEVPDSEVAAAAKAKLNFTHDIGHPPQHQGCDCTIEAEGFQQTLGLFPESEVPLLSNAQRYKYVNPALRPDDPALAEAWDRTVDMNRVLRDEFIDRDTAWTGVINRTPDGDWGNTAEWDGSISFDLSIQRNPSERFHLMLHESLHHFSADALDQSAFLGYRGWEEGLVEKLTRLYRDDVATSLGMNLDTAALKTWESATNYNRYITQLEKIRRSLGTAPLDFYQTLHAVPTNQRLGLVKDIAQGRLASGEWTQVQLEGFLKTVDDAHLILQV